MTKDLHIYTNGVDPFVFSLGDVTVHVHSGAPNTEPAPPAASPPKPPTVLDPPLEIAPERGPGAFSHDVVAAVQRWLDESPGLHLERPLVVHSEASADESNYGVAEGLTALDRHAGDASVDVIARGARHG